MDWIIQQVSGHAFNVCLAGTHALMSLSSHCELIIDGKDVDEQIIKHSQVAYSSGIVFERW